MDVVVRDPKGSQEFLPVLLHPYLVAGPQVLAFCGAFAAVAEQGVSAIVLIGVLATLVDVLTPAATAIAVKVPGAGRARQPSPARPMDVSMALLQTLLQLLAPLTEGGD